MPKSRKRKRKSKIVGTVDMGSEVLPLNEEALEVLLRQKAKFRQKFGRDPGPHDPLMFDPNSDVPVPYPYDRMKRETLEAMRRAGTPPHIIYAYQKTDRLIMEGVDYPKHIRKEWNAAVEEYFDLERKAKEQKS